MESWRNNLWAVGSGSRPGVSPLSSFALPLFCWSSASVELQFLSRPFPVGLHPLAQLDGEFLLLLASAACLVKEVSFWILNALLCELDMLLDMFARRITFEVLEQTFPVVIWKQETCVAFLSRMFSVRTSDCANCLQVPSRLPTSCLYPQRCYRPNTVPCKYWACSDVLAA